MASLGFFKPTLLQIIGDFVGRRKADDPIAIRLMGRSNSIQHIAFSHTGSSLNQGKILS